MCPLRDQSPRQTYGYAAPILGKVASRFRRLEGRARLGGPMSLSVIIGKGLDPTPAKLIKLLETTLDYMATPLFRHPLLLTRSARRIPSGKPR
jgi:hypothetical protein